MEQDRDGNVHRLLCKNLQCICRHRRNDLQMISDYRDLSKLPGKDNTQVPVEAEHVIGLQFVDSTQTMGTLLHTPLERY
jgi:hypothetical protein